jgi:hypothetical protein
METIRVSEVHKEVLLQTLETVRVPVVKTLAQEVVGLDNPDTLILTEM